MYVDRSRIKYQLNSLNLIISNKFICVSNNDIFVGRLIDSEATLAANVVLFSTGAGVLLFLY